MSALEEYRAVREDVREDDDSNVQALLSTADAAIAELEAENARLMRLLEVAEDNEHLNYLRLKQVEAENTRLRAEIDGIWEETRKRGSLHYTTLERILTPKEGR